MHRQLQKLGFFGPKTLEADNSLKFLYKKDAGASYKRKIRSANDAEPRSRQTHRRHHQDEKRPQRKKSSESLSRKRKKDPRVKNFGSETDICFISPEETTKRRKKVTKHRERSPEVSPERRRRKTSAYDPDGEKRKSLKREIDVVKENKYKHKNSNDDHWITRKEIVKMFTSNKPKEVPNKPSTSNFLKRFFLFDKQEPSHDKAKRVHKTYRYSEDNTNRIYDHYKASPDRTRKNEKTNKKKHKVDSVDVVYTRDMKKHRERHKSGDRKKERVKDKTSLGTEEPKTPHKKVKQKFQAIDSLESSTVTSKPKRKSPSRECDLIFDELKSESQVTKVKRKSRSRNVHEDNVTESQISNVSTKKPKPKKHENEDLVSEDTKIRNKGLESQVASNVTNNSVKHKKRPSSAVIEPKKYPECKFRSRESSVSPSKRKESSICASNKIGSSRATSTDRESLTKKRVKNQLEKNISRVNAKRHCSCLVKSTFPVVEIPPFIIHQSCLEKKKKHKTFKKYYKYNNTSDQDELTSSSVFLAFSDSYKRYQDSSDYSLKESPKSRNQRSKFSVRDLKVETHISSIVINPEPQNYSTVTSNIKPRKSRIPILNNISRTVESAKQGLMSYRRSRKEIQVEEKGINTRLSRSPSRESKPETKEKTFHEDDSKISKASTITKHKINEKNCEKEEIVEKKEPNTSSTLLMSKLNEFKNEIQKGSTRSSSKSSRTRSPLRTYRKYSAASTHINMSSKSPVASSSKRSVKAAFVSKSDTKIKKRNKTETQRKYKTLGRISAKTALKNSTSVEKSHAFPRPRTSYLTTKSFKDNEKLSRWQRSKIYSDLLRQKFINKKRSSGIPPQIMEVRYLTVEKPEQNVKQLQIQDKNPNNEDVPDSSQEFFEEDVPQSSFEPTGDNFKEFFEDPIDEILNENYNFLQKDFTSSLNVHPESSDDLSLDDFFSENKLNEWYDLCVSDRETGSICEIMPYRNNSKYSRSEDRIIDSVNACVSEESGYSTIKSRQISTTFFQRPEIKALLKPFETTLGCCVEVKIEAKDSVKGLEICSIESKSLQTSFVCLQKSVQIKLSEEELSEGVKLSEINKEDQPKEEKESGQDTKNEDQESEEEDSVEKVDYVEIKRVETKKSLALCEKVNCVIIEPEIEATKKRKNECFMKRLFLSCFCPKCTDK